MAKYGDKVSLVYRHFPLPMHRQAGKAAEGAECAREQQEQAFWGFHDALFADQKPWTTDDLIGYAEGLELDVQAFTSCLNSGRHAETVMKDVEQGQEVGMSGTPGFYVNGIVISGAQPASVFIDIIDKELARVGG
jgi:protein-disulfide isomerase